MLNGIADRQAAPVSGTALGDPLRPSLRHTLSLEINPVTLYVLWATSHPPSVKLLRAAVDSSPETVPEPATEGEAVVRLLPCGVTSVNLNVVENAATALKERLLHTLSYVSNDLHPMYLTIFTKV